MRHKVAAARQLGPKVLVGRLSWRCRQLWRAGLFHAARRGACRRFAACAEPLVRDLPLRSFLPDFDAVASILGEPDGRNQEAIHRTLEHAAGVCADRPVLRGIGAVDLRFTGANWYDYEAGDAIMVNRHDFLLPLVQCHVLTGEARYAAKITSLFEYWVDHFDARRLRDSDTPIDSAIRLVNWAWVFNSDALSLGSQRRRRLCEIIGIQLEYIYAWHSAGGNHLVLEALALYVYGTMFPHTRRRWRRWGRRVLLTELLRQTSSDGVHTEQSTFYHHAVTTHFLKFLLTADASGDEIGERYRARFAAMLDYIHSTTKPNLGYPVLGDGEALVTDDREHWEARGLLAARWVLFGEPVQVELLPAIDDSACWLLGCRRRDIGTSDEPLGTRVFHAAGLAVLRAGPCYVIFDAAPFSDPAFPHHGHADALSFELCVGDDDLLVDPGGYGYYDDRFRRFFRSTAAHNTIAVDGRDQSELFGVLGYGRLASAAIHRTQLGDDFDYIAASHDGYDPLVHQRELFLWKKPYRFLLIVDRLTGQGSHTAVSRYHAAAGITVDATERRIRSLDDSRHFGYAAVASSDIDEIVTAGRRDGDVQGWVSPATRQVAEAQTLELRFGHSDRSHIVTVFGLDPGVPVTMDRGTAGIIRLSVGGRRYELSFGDNADEPSTISE